MTTSTTSNSISMPISRPGTAISHPWFMLISRSVLFLVIQVLIALIVALTRKGSLSESWNESARWWTFMAFLANFASIYILVRLFKAEGNRYMDMIRFSRETWKTDLFWFFVSSFITLPIAALPMNILGSAIFGDPMTPTLLMFRPLPGWAFALSFLFPLTIGFAELPTYFAYCMPRLEAQLKNGWVAWLLASCFLAAQHIFLPLILDGGFILWRLLMYLPFALFVGLLIKLRPTLLPYAMIVHALADLSAVLVYLTI